MSINNAQKFIHNISENDELRTRLVDAINNSERELILQNENLFFNYNEFDNAYNMLLTKCQSQGQIEKLNEINLWWNLLLNS